MLPRARKRSLATLARGYDLGLGDKVTWTSDELHERRRAPVRRHERPRLLLFSEDLKAGQRYDGVLVVDPFA